MATKNRICFQDTFILKGSILENIAFGVKEIDYDYDLIKEVLKLANLEEFVAKRNLNYLLDENGKTFPVDKFKE